MIKVVIETTPHIRPLLCNDPSPQLALKTQDKQTTVYFTCYSGTYTPWYMYFKNYSSKYKYYSFSESFMIVL